MSKHADNIPPREAAILVQEMMKYPTWALEVALCSRAPEYSGTHRDQKFEDMLEECASKLNILDYLDLVRQHTKHPWPTSDMPSVLKNRVDKDGHTV